MIEGQNGVSWEDCLALARACEAHHVPALFRSDHYLNLGGQAELGSLDAWATLSALAAVTSTLRLGTLVSPATFRHPSELAKVVATADHVSGGRVELGLGAGSFWDGIAAMGGPRLSPGESVDALSEANGVLYSSAQRAASFALRGPAFPPMISGGCGCCTGRGWASSPSSA